MKLVVIIPAYNEEKNIKEVIIDIPRKIPGLQTVEVLVIDDGSTDKTVDVAYNAGANKIISHGMNMGVGAAFMTGIRNAISMNADIVVTLDADSQFNPSQISDLLMPILNNQADVVIGSRFLKNSQKYPKIKFLGNKIFTKLVSNLTGQSFTDAQTGFRAYSKDALLSISVVNEFTYTQEVLIDLKFKGFKIFEVPINVFYDTKRKSRVVKNIFSYSWRALSIIFRSMVFHKPMMTFGLMACFLVGGGILGKILTISKIIGISAGLTTGFIILGIVSFMLGIFASIVFKRQAFSEKDLRYYVNEFKKFQGQDNIT